MFDVCRILVSNRFQRLVAAAAGLVLLAGCGQRGALFLPTEPAAQGRATLPQTLRPVVVSPPAALPSPPPATGTASPIPMTP
ncbi:MAG: lipoprotein [Pseudomonadota bacterium]|nr:lipoprotein [Pseudomonadota bacterium]